LFQDWHRCLLSRRIYSWSRTVSDYQQATRIYSIRSREVSNADAPCVAVHSRPSSNPSRY
jgi:hypothetical protein